MNNFKQSIILIVFVNIFLVNAIMAQVGINDNNASPDASAMLDVRSIDKGMLIPRMTTAQRNLINSPADGLMIYNTIDSIFNYYTGISWLEIGKDNLGNHTATQNLKLNGKFLSNNGGNAGIRIDDNGQMTANTNNTWWRSALFQSSFNGGNYIEVNNQAGTRALFGADGNNFAGGSTSDVVLGNWSNGGLNIYTNAVKRVSINNSGLFQLDGNFKLVNGSQGAGKVLTSDVNGLATWTTPTAGSDNLGNHTATQNLKLGSNWLSADGDNEGILISNTGQVGIGKVSSVNHLFQVAGDLLFHSDITTPSTIVTTSSSFNNYPSTGILDNNEASKWATVTLPVTITFDLGSPQVVTYYSIKTEATSPNSGISPTDWTVEGSNDNSSWTALTTESTTIFSTAIRDTFATNNTTAYQYYRLNNVQNNHANAFAVQIYEMELFNSLPTNTNILTVSDVGDIQFNSAYTFPREDGSTNQVLKTDGSGQLTWKDVNSTLPTLITDADNNTKIQVEKTTNEDIIRFDINGIERMRLVRNNNSATTATRLDFPNNYGNVLLGENAGSSAIINSSNNFGQFNTYIGVEAGKSDQNGYNNTYLGYQAGQNVVNGIGNVLIGYQAGQNVVGSNQLFIHNSNSTSPLIYGNFATGLLRVNGSLNINNTYTLPTTDGVTNAVLKTNGSGTLSWINTILDVAQINGDNLELSISGDNAATHQINLSTIDNQKTDVFQLSGDLLQFSLENDGIATQSVNLNAIDNQKTDVFQLSGDLLQFSLENDGIATQSLNLASIDNQTLDVLQLSGDNLQISLHNDGAATHSLNLASIDNQQLDVLQLSGNNLQISLQNDGIATQSVNLATIDNQKTDVFQLSGNSIQLSLENDGIATQSIDLSHQISTDATPLLLENTNSGIATVIEVRNGTGTGAYFGVGGTGTGTGGTSNNDVVIGNRANGNMQFNTIGGNLYLEDGDFGIGINPINPYKLTVAGNAYKYYGGSWVSSSDRRLKKNIQPLSAEEMLNKLLAIQGVTYEWNDHTGRPRPEGMQYGFIAQNVQEVFPSLVSEDDLGYLVMPYGTYDAMTIEALRALNNKIEILKTENEQLKTQVKAIQQQQNEIDELKAIVQQLQTQISE